MRVRLDDYGIGARLATDLVNTAPEVQVSSGDALPDPDALLRFLHDRGLRPDVLRGGRRPARADVDAVRALRRPLREVIETADQEEAVTRAGLLTAQVGVGPFLDRDASGALQWSVGSRSAARLADELALVAGTGLLAVLRILGHTRFRHCAAPTCNGVFVDTSRAGRRRYCEPETCGNRVNVANYRRRRRSGTGDR